MSQAKERYISDLKAAGPYAVRADALVQALASELGVDSELSREGASLKLRPRGQSGAWLQPRPRKPGRAGGLYINLDPLMGGGGAQSKLAASLRSKIESIPGANANDDWPVIPFQGLVEGWKEIRRDILEPFFAARMTM